MAARVRRQQAQKRQQELVRRRLVIGTIAVAVVVILFVIGFIRQQPPIGSDGDPFALTTQPMLGDPAAPVAVVEFGDFKCPFCAMFAEQVFPGLKEAYIDTGKARFYFINFAFLGDDSFRAARAAEAVYDQDPQAFWDYFAALYARQGPENVEWATRDFLLDLAREVAPDLDFEALAAAIEDRAYQQRVQDDIQIARRLGINGVPTLFVNGERVSDWTLDGLSAAIEAALANQETGQGAD